MTNWEKLKTWLNEWRLQCDKLVDTPINLYTKANLRCVINRMAEIEAEEVPRVGFQEVHIDTTPESRIREIVREEISKAKIIEIGISWDYSKQIPADVPANYRIEPGDE